MVYRQSSGIKEYSIENKEDTIIIYKETFEDARPQIIWKFYKKNDNYYTNDFGERELIMSTFVTSDSLYRNPLKYRAHRIIIKKLNASSFSTSIFMVDVNNYLSLKLFYDKHYKIYSMQNWFSYETYTFD